LTSITSENYFSPENNLAYVGSSQFKSFLSCESAALAEIRGEYIREKSTALLVGSYVDAFFSSELDLFKAKNPEIFLKNGGLKSEYIQAENIIRRIERDNMFMVYLAGQPQVIMTGEIMGVPVKIKIDSYHPGKCIVDLKIMKDFAPIWVDGEGKLPFVEAWRYDIQAAIYQEIERQNRGTDAEPLPVFLACASKQKTTRLKIISIPNDTLVAALCEVGANIGRYAEIKAGITEPERCGICDFCAETEVLTEIVDYREVN
jgi:hypothetical protein